MNNRLIKSYTSRRYRVELYETPYGKYVVQYDKANDELQHSEDIEDFNLASFMFEMKCTELEGM